MTVKTVDDKKEDINLRIKEELKKQYQESKRIINEAALEGRLVLFVGAGASISSGMPSWGQAVNAIADRLELSKEERDDYLKIPQYFYNARGKKEYTQYMRKLFSDEHCFPKYPLHSLIINFNAQTIITTNYDHLIENAARENSEMITVISHDSDMPYKNTERELIKMHGDFEHDNYVLKEDDFLEYSKNFRLIENYVKSLIGTKVILFIGYSYNDPDVKHIFSWAKDILQGDFQPAYLIYTGKGYNKNVDDYFKHFGINVLYASVQLDKEYSEDQTDNLEKMLRWLQDKDVRTALEELYEKIKVYKHLEYPYRNVMESVLRQYHINIENDHMLLEGIPGYYETKENSIQARIFYALAYERFCQNKLSSYIKVGEENSCFALDKKYKPTDDEKKYISGILDILNKSSICGMELYIPVDDDYPAKEEEKLFNNNLHHIYVDFEEPRIPEWMHYMRTFNDEKLYEVIEENNNRLNYSKPNLYVEQAFIYVYFGKYLSAYNSLKEASHIYYEKGETVKFFISEINRYYIGRVIRFHGSRYGIKPEEIDSVSAEIKAIDLEKTYRSLPDLGSGKTILKDIFSFELSYRLFYDSYRTGEKVKEEANTQYSLYCGLPAFAKMEGSIGEFYYFMSVNGVILDIYSENHEIYSLLFKSMLASVTASDVENIDKEGDSRKFIETHSVHAECITDFVIYIGLKFVPYSDLKKIVKNIDVINVEDNGRDYLEQVLENTFENRQRNGNDNHRELLWKVILILGHIKQNENLFAVGCQKICLHDSTLDYLTYSEQIIRFVYMADKCKVISDKNGLFISNLLTRILEHIIVHSTDERILTRVARYLSYICDKYGIKYNNEEVIVKLLEKNNRDVCVEIYPYVNRDLQERIKQYAEKYELQDKTEDYIFYLKSVGNNVIKPDRKQEQKIMKFCISEHKNNEQKENSEKRGIDVLGSEPIYISLIAFMCNHYLSGLIREKSALRKLVKSIGEEFYVWLVDIEKYDYSKFDIEWLDRCSDHLLGEISQKESVHDKIRRSVVEKYSAGTVKQSVIDKYFEFFAG